MIILLSNNYVKKRGRNLDQNLPEFPSFEIKFFCFLPNEKTIFCESQKWNWINPLLPHPHYVTWNAGLTLTITLRFRSRSSLDNPSKHHNLFVGWPVGHSVYITQIKNSDDNLFLIEIFYNIQVSSLEPYLCFKKIIGKYINK